MTQQMAYETCTAGRDTTCLPCGHDGEPCCPVTPQCRDGVVCTNGSCVVKRPAPYERCNASEGDKCQGDTSCLKDPSGAMFCTRECSTEDDCPDHPRRFCGVISGPTPDRLCFHFCDSDADCPTGMACRPYQTMGLCRPKV